MLAGLGTTICSILLMIKTQAQETSVLKVHPGTATVNLSTTTANPLYGYSAAARGVKYQEPPPRAPRTLQASRPLATRQRRSCRCPPGPPSTLLGDSQAYVCQTVTWGSRVPVPEERFEIYHTICDCQPASQRLPCPRKCQGKP
ncbi:uncharacterized protein B0I36DRAFT_3704 [Microdochium trichocladiopsis]|uniref:Uncharacterized protein n=1 Tax=Microdochium trichocladiopsis TaxID=1682393 RepID=A0A9P9BTG1_9PEZI|nr:uncharacterized protein B0I36DRAFT_3704 [Microdochium trichocladiopsis]KAH7039941.1 hypothetical protein B0I36DRAFT_3704 [Microdochium trichocladiopsis]